MIAARSAASRTTHRWVALAAGVATLPIVYPLVLVAAARHGQRRAPAPAAESLSRFLVLIPAHDEEEAIGGTLRGLARVTYPAERMHIVVVADNCSDRTGDLAAAAGADVRVRSDSRRGKGQALAWALDELRNEVADCDAVVFIDADCQPSTNFLLALDARLAAGASAAQVDYSVANAGDSWPAALRWAAFALMNFVRPLGRDVLGLSCGISGTGFALSRGLLAREPWLAFSLAEDVEYHLRLVAAGERVRFVPEASVTSPMPTTLAASEQQNLRWEGGKWQLARRWAPSLLAAGMRKRDPRHLLAAVELVLPPQSLLLAWTAALGTAGTITRSRPLAAIAVLAASAQGAYIVGGLRVARAPADVYRALAMAPLLAAWKVTLQLRVLGGRGPSDWIGTRTAS